MKTIYFLCQLSLLIGTFQCAFAQQEAAIATPNPVFADIHAHVSLRPYNSTYPDRHEETDLWQEQVVSVSNRIYRFPKYLGQYEKVPAVSSANLNKLAKGNVRIVFASICPIQQEFTQFRTWTKPLMLNKQKRTNLMTYFSGSNHAKIEQLQRKQTDYFEETLNELNFLQRDCGKKAPNSTNTYKIARNYTEIQQILQTEPNTIIIIPNIEGGHALGTGMPQTLQMASQQPELLEKQLKNNIQQLKQTPYPIFSITLANHFWNQLCGQTRTNHGAMTALVNEKIGQSTGITPLGYTVIDELLSDKNGKPILIDIKHMSIESRLDFYRIIESKYPNLPIIYSHGGVNGLPNSYRKFDKNNEFIKDKGKEIRKNYLHPWSFNLYDDEIEQIYHSKGIIGIMLEDTRLGGKMATKAINKTLDGTYQRRDEYIKVFMANAFHIVNVIKKPDAWNIIAVGSDFDGAINPMNQYADASRFPELRADLIDFLYRVKQQKIQLDATNYVFSNQEIVALMYDLTPEQIVDMVMFNNTNEFLMQNFK